MEISKAKDKISKLLNMTVANGATEDEQANAMRLAAGIATRAGIELEACRPAGSVKPKIGRKGKPEQMKVYESYCAEAAAILYGVECRAPNYGKWGFEYIGREENIDLAEQTMLWLVRQVELLYKQHLPRGLSVRARAEFRGSFKDACANRVYFRAIELIREMKTNEKAAQSSTGHNALVVASHFDTLRGEIQDYYNESYQRSIAASEERRKLSEDRRANMLALMSESDRVTFLANEAATQAAWEKEANRKAKKARPYKEPRGRSMKRGSGTGIGLQAGDAVKLREEID